MVGVNQTTQQILLHFCGRGEAVHFRDTETNCSDNYKWNIVTVSQDLMMIVTPHDMSRCHTICRVVSSVTVLSVSSNIVCLHILPLLPLMCTMIATSWPHFTACDPWFAVLHLANVPGINRDLAGLCPYHFLRALLDRVTLRMI